MATLFDSIDQFTSPGSPLACTLGTMDGVHLGHQALIASTIAAAPYSVALTLDIHPSEIVRNKKVPLLCSLEQRLWLLSQTQLDGVILLDFTPSLSQKSATVFLSWLKEKIPFTHLVLGHDARFGRGRDGSPEVVYAMGKQLGFEVTYLNPVLAGDQPVSSTRIREALRTGNLKEVETLLGRPYSLFGTVVEGKQIGHRLGFPTANFAVSGLCLPPFGVYACRVRLENDKVWHPAVANLGYAPTVRSKEPPFLEAHILDKEIQLKNKRAEVQFVQFLREERHFSSPEALRSQIASDTTKARHLF